jgi:putative nucleotidyltransferase with HDIG domain
MPQVEHTILENRSDAVRPAGSSLHRDLRGKLTLARLPTMPQILVRLLDLCQRDDVNLTDLAALISRDAGMAAKIFAVSSSAAFVGRNRPATLEQCLSLLGMNAIKTIVINESIMQVFNRFTSGSDFDLRDFWGHSLRCALIARALAREMDYASLEEAYLGGLMHDVGRLAMLATDPDGYARLFYELGDSDELCAVESQIFALTHAEVGAWLVEKWELDSFLGDCVLYHHEPAERVVSAHPLVRIVLLANRLSARRGEEASLADQELAALCGAVVPDLSGLLAGVEVELVKVAEQFGIQLDAPAEPRDSAPAAPARSDEQQLAARVQDILLVNQVLADATGAEGQDAVLQGLTQAMKILFDVDAALCFEPVDAQAESFQAKPLGVRWRRVAQLRFATGSSNSALARAAGQGAAVLTRGSNVIHVLDDQVLRLLGGEGILLLPLRTGRKCLGILVAAIDSAARAQVLRQRLACLDDFGRQGAERLVASSRGTAVATGGQEAAGRLNRLVHEISNPLSIIRNYLHILESDKAGNDAVPAQLGIVREEIERVAKIVRSVRGEQEKQADPEPAPVDLNRIIEDLVALCRASVAMDAAVDIRLELAEGLPEIVSDGDRLKQLFLNLLKNAVEAMPGGGSVRVSTAPWGAGATASHVEICIEDTGPGLPKEVLAKLYQSVPSSKGGQHQGLGLAIVGQLVRDLRGLINCRSGAQGTRFQVLLPFNGK